MNTKNKFSFKTMRLYTFVPAALFCALFLYACDFPGASPDGQNYLTVNFPGASGDSNALSVLSDNQINLLVYKVTFTGPGGTVIERTVGTGSISIALEAGKWVIAAEAYDPGNMLVGTGTATVTVVPGQSQSVTILMYVNQAYESLLDVISIHSEAELRRIGTDFDIDGSISFNLERDIVLTQWTPIGDGTPSFAAIFNGNGHSITINSFSSTVLNGLNLGLFGKTDGAYIEDLTIIYPNLTVNAAPSADSYMGGLAGQADATTIANVHVKGVIAYTDYSSSRNLFIGGLVGAENSAASISNSSFTGTLTVVGGANVTVRAGGIAGASHGVINTSYAAGTTINVTTPNHYMYAGGIAGWGSPNIQNCYSAAGVTVKLTGTASSSSIFASAGGIIGSLNTSGLVSKCYALGPVTVMGTIPDIYAGGIAGQSASLIENCAALANVNGGFTSNTVGRVIGDSTGTNNYAASNTTLTCGTPNVDNGNEAYTLIEFQGEVNQSKYDTNLFWTFGVPWKWIIGYNYPVLSWQTAAP